MLYKNAALYDMYAYNNIMWPVTCMILSIFSTIWYDGIRELRLVTAIKIKI